MAFEGGSKGGKEAAQAASAAAIGKAKSSAKKTPKGRKDANGVEGLLVTKPFKDNFKRIVAIEEKMDNLKVERSELYKVTAEQCKGNVKSIRAAVQAKRLDKIAEVLRDCEQTELFIEAAASL